MLCLASLSILPSGILGGETHKTSVEIYNDLSQLLSRHCIEHLAFVNKLQTRSLESIGTPDKKFYFHFSPPSTLKMLHQYRCYVDFLASVYNIIQPLLQIVKQ